MGSLLEYSFNVQDTRATSALLQCCLADALMRVPGNPDPTRDNQLEALICDCLDMLLTTLPPQQASIVRAVDLEGELPQSVAESHGLSLNQATTHLALGRQGLKDRFREILMICPLHGLAGCACHLKGDAGT